VSRALKITITILAAMVLAGLVTLPSLRKALQALSGSSRTPEQARREVMDVPVSTPAGPLVEAQMFWLSTATPASLEPVKIELPLSQDSVDRSRQLINALIMKAPAPEQRTLPIDCTLLAFYLRPDGIAVADFSDALSSNTPSGILSEQRVVDSLTQTLGANVPQIRQLKILIHGQEAETLAGHLDLSGAFRVASPVSADAVTPPVITPATVDTSKGQVKVAESAATPGTGKP